MYVYSNTIIQLDCNFSKIFAVHQCYIGTIHSTLLGFIHNIRRIHVKNSHALNTNDRFK